MPAGFTLKGLSPSRASLSLSIPPSGQPSPLSSPGRSPRSITDDRAEYVPVSTPSPIKAVTRDEAIKVVKRLEEVLAAWNDYRLSLAASGKAGRRLASAMKDLCGVLDKADVPCKSHCIHLGDLAASTNTLNRSYAQAGICVVGGISGAINQVVQESGWDVRSSQHLYLEVLHPLGRESACHLGGLGKKLNPPKKESRSHDAYLNAIGKKHDKAEKAYRKVSKTLNDSAAAHSGIEAYKTSLADDIARSAE